MIKIYYVLQTETEEDAEIIGDSSLGRGKRLTSKKIDIDSPVNCEESQQTEQNKRPKRCDEIASGVDVLLAKKLLKDKVSGSDNFSCVTLQTWHS